MHVRKHMEQFAAINTKILSSPQRKLVHHNHAASAPDERLSQASRGKSMEEFGASPVTKPKALSKSSDQLDLRPSKYAPSGAEKRTEPIPTEDRLTQFPVKSLSCESSLTGDESTNITASLQPTPSNDEEIHDVPHSENHTDASTNKQQDSFPQDENEMAVSSENILLDSSTTTDPSPLINNEEENTPQSSEEPVLTRPQNEQIPPPEEKTTSSVASLPEMMEVESKQIPALSEEPEMIFKKEKDLSAFGDVREGVGSLEKLHWDVLVQEVASADQSLVHALYPVSNRKTALMLMEQLLSEDSHLMEEHYKKKQEQSPESDEPPHGTEISVGEKAPITELFANCQSVLKAQRDDAHSPEMDVTKKKKQLIARLQHQLKHLHSIHSSLHTEEQVNGAKAEAMEALVREHCVPLELERYTLFITDLERVISLLLCLCARLARESLDSRHRLLCKQRDDAKDLKENLNRRERQVSSFLQKRLTHTQLQEYSHLIQSKASLLIRLTDVQERQWLAEQQLQALIGSLPA
ncbi:hypothetical protein DNTS_025533 [Danionella cerebrum]|uniref:ASD2 domain-containing protein n=1 Tax=Danionella cerebrum TaxID=2873325 RepID=A0A553MY56_9TELE|nr:hypothetical protein DNTS_025533 [Danionella translucida]